MNGESIINLAVNVEKQGEIFYKKLADIVDEKFKNVLLELANQEREHAELFSKLSKEENWNEIDSYIFSYVYNLIPDLEQIINDFNKDKIDLKTIFDIAIGIEKDSIILYYELKDQIINTEIKELLKKIINQEKMHIETIFKMKEDL